MGDDVEITAGKPKSEIDDDAERREARDDEKERDDRYRKDVSNPLRVTD